MKYLKPKSTSNIVPIKPDNPSIIFLYRRALYVILASMAVVIILNSIFGNQAQVILSLFALGFLITIVISMSLS